MSNEEHIWGENVKRIVIWTPEDKRIIYHTSELKKDETVFYIKAGKESFVGIWDVPFIGPDAPNKKVALNFIKDKYVGFVIDAHVEQIPHGPNDPKKYELVTDEKYNIFEIVGDYSVLKTEIEKQDAVRSLVSKLG